MGGVPLVQLQGISKRFSSVTACESIDLEIHAGDFLALLGPSGSGKTTLLRIIGGFAEPDSGRVFIDGADVTDAPPEARPTNMVFQGYSLFPHMTVRQNIGYGLKVQRVPKQEADRRIAEAVELTRLNGLEGRAIQELSGGQQQRVALARALVLRPKVLLLDEPLSALDLKLRQSMQEELRRIHRSIGGTFVFVTHDQTEALWLANRIAVMANGRIVQQGSGQEIYAAPASRFVSSFIGEANSFTGQRRDDRVHLDCGVSFPHQGPDQAVAVMIRPHRLRIGGVAQKGDELHFEGRLADLVFLGSRIRYTVIIADGAEIAIDAAADEHHAVEIGEPVAVVGRVPDLIVVPAND